MKYSTLILLVGLSFSLCSCAAMSEFGDEFSDKLDKRLTKNTTWEW